jgi:hypothetical protein
MSKPAAYRKNIISKILDAIVRGESVSLIGVGSSGKSNVARHIVRADARAACLGLSAEGMHGVLVDCMQYVDDSAIALYRLVFQALVSSTQQPDAPEAIAKLHAPLNAQLEKSFDTEQVDRVRFYLEGAIDQLMRAGVKQMFFVLDDFDHALKKAPGQAVNSLRGLRDNHKNRLMYITVTRKELTFLRDEGEYEDFAEIVTPVTIPVGMYAYPDAQFALEELVARWNLQGRLDASTRANILEWSGQHPGMLKAILNIANRNPSFDLGSRDALTRLFNHKDIEPECDKIWQSLEADEQEAMRAAFSGQTADAMLIGRLKNKELLRERTRGQFVAFSPIFEDYVIRNRPPSIAVQKAQVTLDPAATLVRIDGRRVLDIDEVEFRLIERLYARRGGPVQTRELLAVLLSNSAPGAGRYSGAPEQRLERYMAAIMQKVNLPTRTYIAREPDAYRFRD